MGMLPDSDLVAGISHEAIMDIPIYGGKAANLVVSVGKELMTHTCMALLTF